MNGAIDLLVVKQVDLSISQLVGESPTIYTLQACNATRCKLINPIFSLFNYKKNGFGHTRFPPDDNDLPYSTNVVNNKQYAVEFHGVLNLARTNHYNM